MLKIYKVYVIRHRKDGVVYVGLTRSTLYKRFNGHVSRRKLDREIYKIELVQDELTLPQAVTLEEMLIKEYQTRENGMNVSPASMNGYSNFHSDEQKRKWSLERKGKPIKGRITREGMKNSDEHNRKISDANSREIICLNNGKQYNSMREACKQLGLSESKVSLVCSGKRPHTKGYVFKLL